MRLLGNAINVRDLSDETVRGMIRERYRVYAGAVDRFQASVSGLLDRPASQALLYDTLMNGQEACWRLDAYSRLTETYGADAPALVSILASSVACTNLRRAAFSRAVRDRIGRSLDDLGESEEQLEILQEEIRELERLVEDLRAIDER